MRHQGTVCYLIGVDRHTYASVNYTATGTDYGLAPVRCQAIFWINAGLLSIGTNSVKFEPIYEDFHSRICIWQYTRETIYLWFTHKIYFPQNHRARSLIMTQDYWSSPSLFVVIVRKTNKWRETVHFTNILRGYRYSIINPIMEYIQLFITDTVVYRISRFVDSTPSSSFRLMQQYTIL